MFNLFKKSKDILTEKQVIKAGTQLILNNAELFTNGTSCTTTRVVFGSISNKNGE